MHGPPHLKAHLETELAGADLRRLGLHLAGLLLPASLLVIGLLHRRLMPADADVAQLILGLGAVIAVVPVLRSAVRGFLSRDPRLSLDQLVALALLASLATGEFVTAILVPLLMSAGHFLEERSVRGARAAIDGLKKLKPIRATRLVPDGERVREVEVEVESLRIDDTIVVRPGDVVPADGTVTRGTSAVDQSSMTGESVAEEVAHGSRVFAGTVNLSGLLEVKVTGVAEHTALGRILELLHDAEQSEAPIMQVIERYARIYLPSVLVLAAAVLVVTQDLTRAIAVLVVSCPCALVLASPSAMTAALAVASRLGVLIKSARFLEALGDVDTLLLDKTGTVTVGQLEVVAVRPIDAHPEVEVLSAGAACAFGSRHPVSRAVVMAAEKVDFEEADTVEEVHGRGMVARKNGQVLRLGSARWLEEEGISVPSAPDHLGPVVWVVRDETVLGQILLADRPREGSRAAIDRMRDLGVKRTVLMTGDRRAVAEAVATELGFDEVLAECLPEQKSAYVEREEVAGRTVMMVGDGVNDALALSRARVGIAIAMGAMGSDVAVESADIALMSSDLGRLPEVIQLARSTRLTIHQNVLIAIATSLGMMALASLGLISPALGAAVHNVGSFVVVFNSARLLRM